MATGKWTLGKVFIGRVGEAVSPVGHFLHLWGDSGSGSPGHMKGYDFGICREGQATGVTAKGCVCWKEGRKEQLTGPGSLPSSLPGTGAQSRMERAAQNVHLRKPHPVDPWQGLAKVPKSL